MYFCIIFWSLRGHIKKVCLITKGTGSLELCMLFRFQSLIIPTPTKQAEISHFRSGNASSRRDMLIHDRAI